MAAQDMQSLMQNWMTQQQELWNNWAKTFQGNAAGTPLAQGVDQWRQAVEQTLETQKEATRAWADQVANVDGAPDDLKRWAAEGVKLFEQWSDAQRGVWDQWFALLEKSGSGGGDPAKQMMSGWEQMAAQMQSLQQQWAANLAGKSGATKKGR